MEWRNKHDRHAVLVDRMAEKLGIDLEEKQLRAELSPEALEGAVVRCMGCDDPVGCDRWVSEDNEKASETPGYCRNSDFLKSLG